MIDLKTKYLGLDLKNPIIVGSSGLTNDLDNICEIEKQGAGAVVLKSVFEEQICIDSFDNLPESSFMDGLYPESYDYIKNSIKKYNISYYIDLIKDCKKAVSIPIIASINCISSSEWISFAKEIEDAGADAIELNVFVLPSDPEKNSADIESIYIGIVENVKKQVSIPISLKIGCCFSGLTHFVKQLSYTGIESLVLFNRPFSPDIDIDNLELTNANAFSSPVELYATLRWVAILSTLVGCDISASTGVHDGRAVIKQLLAGATTVQITSVLYNKGFEKIKEMVKDVEDWMEKHGFNSIDDFRGKLSYQATKNPAAFERVQFMMHFAGIE